jgi:phosphoribosylaminoimidazole (AIR) synthetase
MNRAQNYSLARKVIRAEKAMTRKEMKRERKTKINKLREYRKIYLRLLDAAMLGKAVRGSFNKDSGDLVKLYIEDNTVPMFIGSDSPSWMNRISSVDHSEARLFVRKYFEGMGLKPWHLDGMER